MKYKFFFLIILFEISGITHAQWVKTSVPLGGYVNTMISVGSNLLAGTERSGFFGTSNGIYRSTDNGVTWAQYSLAPHGVTCFLVDSTNLYAGTDNWVNVSTDNGYSWTNLNPNFYDLVYAITKKGSNLFIGYGGGVWLNNGIVLSYKTYSLAALGNGVFAGTYMNGIYRSTNNGINWLQVFPNNNVITVLQTRDNKIYAGANGIYTSLDSGNSWQQISNNPTNCIAFSNSNIIAGGYGVNISTNNGSTWITKNEGFVSGSYLNFLLVANNYVFAAIDSNVWRRPISDLIGIENISTVIPKEFSLYQNYPNPFNPTTKIKFDIPKSAHVSIKIYDLLGKQVATLVNEYKQPGFYEVEFNGSNFASGVYIYKIEAGDFSSVKKMVLIK